MINGIHHLALNCIDDAEYQTTIEFYTTILGLSFLRKWRNQSGEVTMLTAGNCILEIFSYADQKLEKGTIRHFAFSVSDVDACVKKVSEAGYPMIIKPKDVVLHSQPPLEIRVAFCNGPVGEEIEFFQEKTE